MNFSYATIEARKANFEQTRFKGAAYFKGTTFTGWAEFSSSQFDGHATFEPDVKGLLRISDCRFADGVSVSWGQSGELQAENLVSEGLVLMDGFRIEQDATFRQSEFKDRVVIANCEVGGTADFVGTSWHAPTDEKYSIEVEDWLVLDGAEFYKPAHWSVKAGVLSVVGAHFRDAASFSLEGSEIIIDRANFERHARFAGEAFKDPSRSASLIRREVLARSDSPDDRIPGALVEDDDRQMQMLSKPGEGEARSTKQIAPDERPELVSMRRIAAGSVGLTDVAVARCRFFDASGLDQLRQTNTSWGVSPWGRAKRRVIGEEVSLRAKRRWSWGWNESKAEQPDWLSDPRLRPIGTAELEPAEDPQAFHVAEVYRQLRKGREDAKDTPGAADFYYGEMEMRRLASKPVSGERLLLTFYWALSGYGLRASRSLIALLILIVAGTYAMASEGYCEPADPFGDSPPSMCVESNPRPTLTEAVSISNLAFTAGTAITVVGAPEAKLTSAGHGIRLVMRLLGPFLLALSLLALRNRVKR